MDRVWSMRESERENLGGWGESKEERWRDRKGKWEREEERKREIPTYK